MRLLFSLTAAALLTACAPAHALSSSDVTYQGSAFSVVTVTPGKDDLKLYWQRAEGKSYGLIGTLKAAMNAQGRTLLFATSSGIYSPGLRPLGLHVQAGRELVGLNRARSGGTRLVGNFAMLPNGVFWVGGGRAGVMESRAYGRSGLKPDYASQSGPLLVQGGRLHPRFNEGSSSLKLRSGVGVCRGGVIRFAISEGGVNFYTFARLFRDVLGCPDALYLDGSISTLYTPERGDRQLVPYAGIWAVTIPRR